MQEDVEHRAVTLAINTTKMTARALKNAILKYLGHRKEKRIHHTISTGSPVKSGLRYQPKNV